MHILNDLDVSASGTLLDQNNEESTFQKDINLEAGSMLDFVDGAGERGMSV